MERFTELLLDRLRTDNGQTLGELVEHLDMSRQAVTKHLAVLEGAGLVVTVWRGREKLHYLNPAPIHEIARRWIDSIGTALKQAAATTGRRGCARTTARRTTQPSCSIPMVITSKRCARAS